MPKSHFEETKNLASQLNPDDVAKWLLEQGFYPEQYVLPPCFNSRSFSIQTQPYFPLTNNQGRIKLSPEISELLEISLPRTMLTQRDYSVIDPRHYHDMVFHIINEWETVVEHLFPEDQNIFSYSFPIPISRNTPGSIGLMRAGRMIYEFLAMAESDLIAEAYKYKYLVRTDIKNYYPSIYSHSISWALQGKASSRADRFNIDTIGKKLDKLTQQCNDGCTNGLAIGPAVTDLISEIILAAVDLDCSQQLNEENIKFIGVRFKDDYRILCDSVDDAQTITRCLQRCMQTYNLALGEGKSDFIKLPEGLYRLWKSLYHKLSLNKIWNIQFKDFELVLQSVLKIENQLPGTGVIDRFLSELTSKKYNLKVKLNEKNRRKFFSLLLLLRERRAKSFPVILAIIESLLEKYIDDTDLHDYIESSIVSMYDKNIERIDENEYEILWLAYFRITVLNHELDPISDCKSQLINSVLSNSREYFQDYNGSPLFSMPQFPLQKNHLLKHLEIFRKQRTGEIIEDEEDSQDDE